jgi:hypothetical protein
LIVAGGWRSALFSSSSLHRVRHAGVSTDPSRKDKPSLRHMAALLVQHIVQVTQHVTVEF